MLEVKGTGKDPACHIDPSSSRPLGAHFRKEIRSLTITRRFFQRQVSFVQLPLVALERTRALFVRFVGVSLAKRAMRHGRVGVSDGVPFFESVQDSPPGALVVLVGDDVHRRCISATRTTRATA